MDKATPRPWEVNDDWLIVENDGTVIADCISTFPKYEASEKDQANAELIVKAVNRDHLFDELVKALSYFLHEAPHNQTREEYLKHMETYKKAKAAK